MESRYYIITSESYSNLENSIEYSPSWNVSGSQCVIEVAVGYEVGSYIKKCRTSNELQDYIYDPIRINEWYEPDESEIP